MIYIPKSNCFFGFSLLFCEVFHAHKIFKVNKNRIPFLLLFCSFINLILQVSVTKPKRVEGKPFPKLPQEKKLKNTIFTYIDQENTLN